MQLISTKYVSGTLWEINLQKQEGLGSNYSSAIKKQFFALNFPEKISIPLSSISISLSICPYHCLIYIKSVSYI